ncbi:hypothetical protein [Guyparkeria halopsychrophila]|uniref:hypothetical protein n=1 Tax=Guyparkeria halopsychrophila TaxID=3139421 RepID=UPI0037CB5E2D
MFLKPFRTLVSLATPLILAACAAPGSSVADPSYGQLNGVLAADASILFVPVGVDNRGCTMFSKRPQRQGILVDSGIWYRTGDGQFVLDANRCVPKDLAPARPGQP